MAKKSSYARQRPNSAQGKSAQHKPQGAATLVRSGAEATPSAANVVEESAPLSAAPAAKATAASAAPSKAAPASAKPAAPATRPGAAAVSTREQNLRMARARATQAAREKRLITAESYAYVLGDLKLVAGLAVTAFIVLIALTFVLPH